MPRDQAPSEANNDRHAGAHRVFEAVAVASGRPALQSKSTTSQTGARPPWIERTALPARLLLPTVDSTTSSDLHHGCSNLGGRRAPCFDFLCLVGSQRTEESLLEATVLDNRLLLATKWRCGLFTMAAATSAA